MSRLGKIGVYGPLTRALQRRISFEVFGLSWKLANVYLYLGDRTKDTPDITDIHTHVFFEVPDRAYAEEPIEIPIGMELMPESKTDFSRFGLVNPLQDETLFRVHIDDYEALGRKLVVGDVFEIPFYKRNGKSSFWEVHDVDDSQEVEKFIHIIHASPLGDARTTREIPIDNSNDDLLEQIMNNADDEYAQLVPSQEIHCDENDVPTEPQPVDNRRKLQRSFLDDPSKEI